MSTRWKLYQGLFASAAGPSWGLFISQRSLCLLLLLFGWVWLTQHTPWNDCFQSRAMWFPAPCGALTPCTPERWGRAVARRTCPGNRASCRLATSVGNHCSTGAMGSSSGTYSWRTHLGRSDFSLRAYRSCVNEGTCWVLWPQDLPWRLQGSHSSSQELVTLNDCSIKKKKGKNPFLKGPSKNFFSVRRLLVYFQ